MTDEGGTTSASRASYRERHPLADDQTSVSQAECLARRSFGTLSTNAVLAAIWYTVKVLERKKIAMETARLGRRTVAMSATQAHTAIGPIQRSRVSGPIRLVK